MPSTVTSLENNLTKMLTTQMKNIDKKTKCAMKESESAHVSEGTLRIQENRRGGGITVVILWPPSGIRDTELEPRHEQDVICTLKSNQMTSSTPSLAFRSSLSEEIIQ